MRISLPFGDGSLGLLGGGSRIRTRGPTTKRKAMGNHSRQASPPRTWTCKWLRLSYRRLQLARPEEPFAGAGRAVCRQTPEVGAVCGNSARRPRVRIRFPPAGCEPHLSRREQGGDRWAPQSRTVDSVWDPLDRADPTVESAARRGGVERRL